MSVLGVSGHGLDLGKDIRDPKLTLPAVGYRTAKAHSAFDVGCLGQNNIRLTAIGPIDRLPDVVVAANPKGNKR